jgi:Mce-associated membrane protein
MTGDDKAKQQNVEDANDVEPSDAVEIDKTTEGADETEPDGTTAPETAPGMGDRAVLWRRVKVFPVVLVLLLLLSAGLAAWLYFFQYRPDEQTDAAAAHAAVDAARDGTVSLLSYNPDNLNQDFAAAKSHLSGDLLNYYDQFTRQIVTPVAKEMAVTTTAYVVGAAVSELHSNSAIVLVYVNQATTSKDRPDPALASSSVRVSLTKVHGNWLITKFDPV